MAAYLGRAEGVPTVTDETVTRETLAAFAERIGVTLTATRASRNPNMDDMPEGSSHWLVTLTLDGRTLDTPYSMGPALRGGPVVAGVLGSLVMDAAGYENAPVFEDWCGEYGYDTDSRKAERTFRAVEAATEALRGFLGAHYEHALWECDAD